MSLRALRPNVDSYSRKSDREALLMTVSMEFATLLTNDWTGSTKSTCLLVKSSVLAEPNLTADNGRNGSSRQRQASKKLRTSNGPDCMVVHSVALFVSSSIVSLSPFFSCFSTSAFSLHAWSNLGPIFNRLGKTVTLKAGATVMSSSRIPRKAEFLALPPC